MTAAKNAIVKAAFELQSSHVCEKRSKNVPETSKVANCFHKVRSSVHTQIMLKLQDLSKFLLQDFITGQATKVGALPGKNTEKRR